VMGILGVPMLLAPVLGPVLGGWLVDDVSWRWIFLINVPIGALIVLGAIYCLADTDHRRVGLDIRGAVLGTRACTAIVFGATEGPELGWGHWSIIGSLVGGFVLGFAMLLLFLAFRSWRLALAVIGLNLMSVGAAYGVMTEVFQHTWAESTLGFTSNGSITTWLPLLAFVILFGLSMDYSILVLERIREAREAGRSPREAAAEGVAATASTVTSAAIVMVFVFAIFATLRLLEMKQLGVGLAAAILIDATIVRALALPAAVTLLGERAFPVKAPFRRGEAVCDDAAMARPALLAADLDG
ncbi:MAG: MMPL family transporter, partial [Patulibacter sp.]|nr:MMPL family transporter [Patulibacter sp.]